MSRTGNPRKRVAEKRIVVTRRAGGAWEAWGFFLICSGIGLATCGVNWLIPGIVVGCVGLLVFVVGRLM
jgi:Flp pilus assembly protein TadB